MKEFGEWDSFYLIVGGAAGALIGLQFVVLTLIAERNNDASPQAGRAFSTPTVLHFSVVLFLAGIVPIPGTTVMAHLIENSGADGVKFTSGEIAELNSAVKAIEIKGQRLPDAVLLFSGVEARLKN